jgi:hypothetical protein
VGTGQGLFPPGARGRLAFPIVALAKAPTVQHDMPYSLHEVGLYLMELGGAVLLLVRGHNSIDEEPPVPRAHKP